MEQKARKEGRILISPLVLFLAALLGFPLLADLIYSISDVGFENITAPRLSGLGNYATALSDPEFWQAAWFSLRFGLIAAILEVALGLIAAANTKRSTKDRRHLDVPENCCPRRSRDAP